VDIICFLPFRYNTGVYCLEKMGISIIFVFDFFSGFIYEDDTF